MCSRTKSVTEALGDVLDIGTKKVLNAVAGDFEAMEDKIEVLTVSQNELKNEVIVIKARVNSIDEKLDYLIQNHIDRNKMLRNGLKEVKDVLVCWASNKYFWLVMGLIILFEYGFSSDHMVEVIERCAYILKGE